MMQMLVLHKKIFLWLYIFQPVILSGCQTVLNEKERGSCL